MAEKKHFNYQVNPIWGTVKEIRDRVKELLVGYPNELVDSAQMTASELVENAVKYGASVDAGGGIQFDFYVDDDMLKIVSKNTIRSDSDFSNLKEHFDKINSAEDPTELYSERLMELLNEPGQTGSQLGLYRIITEGQFHLDIQLNEKLVEITAHRKINP